MHPRFPILEMAKQAYLQPLRFKKGILYTVGFVVATVVLTFLFMSFVVSNAPDSQAVWDTLARDGKLTNRNTENFPVGMFLSFFLVLLIAYAWLFNFWIRYGALGAERASFPSFFTGIGAAFVTLIKFFLIAVVLIAVALVVLFFMSLLGFMNGEIAVGSFLGGFTLVHALMINMVMLAILCGIYSMFSSNLTMTALGTDKEEAGPAHVLEFALVLILVQLVYLIPLLLIQTYTSVLLTLVFQMIGTFWLMAAVPTAHGIRYDWQKQMFHDKAKREFFGDDEPPTTV